MVRGRRNHEKQKSQESPRKWRQRELPSEPKAWDWGTPLRKRWAERSRASRTPLLRELCARTCAYVSVYACVHWGGRGSKDRKTPLLCLWFHTHFVAGSKGDSFACKGADSLKEGSSPHLGHQPREAMQWGWGGGGWLQSLQTEKKVTCFPGNSSSRGSQAGTSRRGFKMQLQKEVERSHWVGVRSHLLKRCSHDINKHMKRHTSILRKLEDDLGKGTLGQGGRAERAVLSRPLGPLSVSVWASLKLNWQLHGAGCF